MIRLFRHYISHVSILQLVTDALVFFFSIYVASSIRYGHESLVPAGHLENLSSKGVLFATIMVGGMTAGGLYESWEWEGGLRGMFKRAGVAAMVGFMALLVIFYLFPQFFLEPYVLAYALVISIVTVSTLRVMALHWMNLEGMKRRVLVLGTGSRAAKIDYLYQHSGRLSRRLNIIGYLPFSSSQHAVDASKILADPERLPDIVKRYNVQEIIVGIRDRRGGLPLDDLLECKLMGVRITELSSFFEREVGALQLDSLNTGWMIHSDGFQRGLLQKRIFDLVVSALLLVVALPIMAVAALLIYLESGAPIIYRQERVGQYGKVFTIYKFRSMRNDAEKDGTPQWAIKNDDRITRLGKILRKLRIDELPQIFNVFNGDMSFVGPRPERPYFVEKLSEEIPLYKFRHNLKPGITGWAQVCFSYGASLEDSVEKLQYDLYYVKNHSLFLDLMILFKTVQIVLWGKGAR
jgi:sugar transferase (PEP-CTERM system associated)